MSLDDFYLTNAEQRALAAANPGNGLLELRGNAGSHDINLATSLIHSVTNLKEPAPKGGYLVPRYDKSMFNGRGDRSPKEKWTVIPTRPDVVLFEGWCYGFSSLLGAAGGSKSNQAASTLIKDPRLLPIDQRLATDYHELHKLMQAWVVVEVESPKWVYRWREEAEANMRRAGKPAMTEAQVADFVDRYMPAYAHYLPGLYKNGPDGAENKPVLSFQIDSMRNPVSIKDSLPFSP
jgi:D-glycerate 3-kinase